MNLGGSTKNKIHFIMNLIERNKIFQRFFVIILYNKQMRYSNLNKKEEI